MTDRPVTGWVPAWKTTGTDRHTRVMVERARLRLPRKGGKSRTTGSIP